MARSTTSSRSRNSTGSFTRRVAQGVAVGVHDQMGGECDAVSVIAAGDELAHGSPCCLLHGDSLRVRAGSQRFLLTGGKPQCHGHHEMVSLRYHLHGSGRRAMASGSRSPRALLGPRPLGLESCERIASTRPLAAVDVLGKHPGLYPPTTMSMPTTSRGGSLTSSGCRWTRAWSSATANLVTGFLTGPAGRMVTVTGVPFSTPSSVR